MTRSLDGSDIGSSWWRIMLMRVGTSVDTLTYYSHLVDSGVTSVRRKKIPKMEIMFLCFLIFYIFYVK